MEKRGFCAPRFEVVDILVIRAIFVKKIFFPTKKLKRGSCANKPPRHFSSVNNFGRIPSDGKIAPQPLSCALPRRRGLRSPQLTGGNAIDKIRQCLHAHFNPIKDVAKKPSVFARACPPPEDAACSNAGAKKGAGN
jgi:hypothetical protein